MKALNISNRLYDIMIGVGGIGSGQFFLMNGNHTLGREESRSGRFLDKNDYCKLHIISHYVKALLGEDFCVLPIGKVGDDDAGKKLLLEMQEIGFSLGCLETDKTKHTLFSFCFLYPDLSGGNMTTDDSACASIGEEHIQKAEKYFEEFAGRGVALAAPEVPLAARSALLEMATKYSFFRVASFTSEEMHEAVASNLLLQVDLLCINFDEALSAIKPQSTEMKTSELINCAVNLFRSKNPHIYVSITKGKEGSYLWNGSALSFLPALKVDALSTAGAGDAFTSGLIIGITAGLTLTEAQELANLVASCSVTSPHTINKELERLKLLDIAKNNNSHISKTIYKMLEV